jgi:hypothetical protein
MSGRIGQAWDIALRGNVYSPGVQMEVNRVPDYMDSVNRPTGNHILDYELWDTLSVTMQEPMNVGGDTPGIITVAVRQRHPLLVSLRPLLEGELRSAESDEDFALGGLYSVESHYPLYMEDMNW